MSRAALLPETEFLFSSASAKRFLAYSPAAQHSILHALRWTVFPEGVFSQVPAGEWLRLLRLTDPLIEPSRRRAETYHVGQGRQLLMMLLSHYLDVL